MDSIILGTHNGINLVRHGDGSEFYYSTKTKTTAIGIRGLARLVGCNPATVKRAIESLKSNSNVNWILEAEMYTPQGIRTVTLVKESGLPEVLEELTKGRKAKKTKDTASAVIKKLAQADSGILLKYRELEALGLADVQLTLKNDLVRVDNGVMVTDSLTIARDFDKQHKNILRDIGSILSQSQDSEISSFFNKHFQESEYLDSANRVQKYYKITREGFSFLVLGFTGDKATKFKIQYIEAFEKMYNDLRGYAIAHFLGRTEGKQLVYVIKNAVTSLIKIGITDNIKRRVAQLQCASGCELEVIFVTPVADNSKEIEKQLHLKFADFRQFGEWFNINPDLVVESIIKHPLVLGSNHTCTQLTLEAASLTTSAPF